MDISAERSRPVSPRRSAEGMGLAELAEHDAPLAGETAELLDAFNNRDLATLAARCDDDFGIVDVAADGSAVVIRDRDEWECWFVAVFAQLDAMHLDVRTEVARYDAVDWGDAAMSVAEFVQFLRLGASSGRVRYVATIVWKRVDGRWVEARWHASELDSDLPPGFGEPT